MKLLFVARHFTYFRNYDAVLRELASRGHTIHLAVEKAETMGGESAVRRLAAEYPTITYGMVPERRADRWSGVARRLRLGLDYFRYLDPAYDAAPLLRIRSRGRTPRLFIGLAEFRFGGRRWRQALAGLMHRLDQAVPPPASIVEYLETQKPDALVITPLVELGSQQIDYVRAARLLGIPSGFAVWSWDNLTSKAYLRDCPDRVFVWNDTQRREAEELHGVPRGRVVVTGAQCFDRWFGRAPSRTREELCRQLGLDPSRPLILYVCSALIKGSPSEAEFVREWLEWVRGSSDPLVAKASVLVRPHPSQSGAWREVDLTSYGPVAIWGGNPIDEASRADYFDSLHGSDVVVGLNTSAFIEAGIVGREVLAVLVPRFYDNQEGTGHFRYLLEVGGGLLRVGRGRDEHLSQLATALRRPATEEHPHRSFVEAFVRPGGLNQPATPVFARAIEELGACQVDTTRAVHPRWRRTAFTWIARMVSMLAGESMIRSPRELDPQRLARIAEAAQAQHTDNAR
jgi:hypothetical protein